MIEALFLQRSHSFFLKQAHEIRKITCWSNTAEFFWSMNIAGQKSWVFSCDTKSDCEFEPKFTCNGGPLQVDATHGLLPPICCLACMALAACAYNETHLAATTSTGWKQFLQFTFKKRCFLWKNLKRYLCFEVFFETPPQWQFCLKINQRISLIKFWMCLIVWCQWSNFAAQPLFGIHACHFLLERLP